MKTFFIYIIFFSQILAADPVANVEARAYQLQAGSSSFCDKSVKPSVEEVDGRKILVLSSRVRMPWGNQASKKGDKQACKESFSDQLSEKEKLSVAVSEVHLECAPKDFVGSYKDTLKLMDKQIEFEHQTLVKNSAGAWTTDPKLPGYTCRWN